MRVTITRLGPRLFDPDNNVSACKDVVDAVAAWVGVDDRDPRYEWVWRQEKSKSYGVQIKVEWKEGDSESDQKRP